MKPHERYGSLTLVERCENLWGGRSHSWLCKCDCGQETKATNSQLKLGRKKTCGCGIGIDRRRLKGNVASLRLLRHVYKNNAKKRGCDFKLTERQLESIVKRPCYYCGCEPYRLSPNNGTESMDRFLYNGIDQVDPRQGYVFGNVVSCCRECNKAKDEMTKDEFREWIIDVYHHFVGEQ